MRTLRTEASISSSQQLTEALSATPAIRRLHETATRLLDGRSLSSEHLAELRRLTSAVTLSELGFQEHWLLQPERVPSDLEEEDVLHPFLRGKVTYLHLSEGSAFTLGIFMIPQHAQIPLHDHPNMTVISRLLFGSMRVRAFDPVVPSANSSAKDPSRIASEEGGKRRRLLGAAQAVLRPMMAAFQSSSTQPLTARLKEDKVVQASTDTLLVLPDCCNIHEFTAESPCAVLDLLTPRYSVAEGRDCTYYEVVEDSRLQRGLRPGEVLLEVVEDCGFSTSSAAYRGVRVEG